MVGLTEHRRISPFTPGLDLETLSGLTPSVAQVAHPLSQSSSHHIWVALWSQSSFPHPPPPTGEEVGKNLICFSSYLCLTGPSSIPPIKKGIRYKTPLVWSVGRIPNWHFPHQCSNRACPSRRNVMTRKEHSNICPWELTSLPPALLVKQKWMCYWSSYDTFMNDTRSKVKMKISVFDFPSWLHTQGLRPGMHEVARQGWLVCYGVSLKCYQQSFSDHKSVVFV